MRKKAFTLMELIVAIAIIGILAGTLLPAVMRARQEAKKVDAIAALHNMDLEMAMSGINPYLPDGTSINKVGLGFLAVDLGLVTLDPQPAVETLVGWFDRREVLELLSATEYDFVADLIGTYGWKTEIYTYVYTTDQLTYGTSSGAYYVGANYIVIEVEDTGNDDWNLAIGVSILAHEGLHAINDQMGTAYSVAYSIDEEWECDVAGNAVWKELKERPDYEGATDYLLDTYEGLVAQGEEETKEALRDWYGFLSEYPGWASQS